MDYAGDSYTRPSPIPSMSSKAQKYDRMIEELKLCLSYNLARKVVEMEMLKFYI